jgi:MFS family permease
LKDQQIGLIVSVSWGFQVLLALLSGMVVDKLGRRRTTLIADILSWAVPALISALAQNFWYFLAAGVVNSIWRVSNTAWNCLLVEEADQSQLVDIFTWIYIANILVGFIAPLAAAFIGAFSLVPTMRGLYVFAAVMFTIKAIVTYRTTRETHQGEVRMHETRHQNGIEILKEYKGVFNILLHSPKTLYTAGILLVLGISSMISGSFWAVLATEKLHVQQAALQTTAGHWISWLYCQPDPPCYRSEPGLCIPVPERNPGGMLFRCCSTADGQDAGADDRSKGTRPHPVDHVHVHNPDHFSVRLDRRDAFRDQ